MVTDVTLTSCPKSSTQYGSASPVAECAQSFAGVPVPQLVL